MQYNNATNKGLKQSVETDTHIENSVLESLSRNQERGLIDATSYPAYSTLPNSLALPYNTSTYIYPVTIPGIEGGDRYVVRTIDGHSVKVRCGTPLGFTRCRSCKATNSKIVHCGNIHCPTCSGYRIRREVKAAVQRLHGFKRATDNPTNPRHVVISFDSWYNAELSPEQVIKSFTNQLSRKLKFLDGYYVLHWFRVDDDVKAAFRNMKEEDRYKGGIWENIKHDFLGYGNFESYVKVAPHIHFVGYGRFPKADKFHEETGIMYKTKSQRSFEFEQCSGNFGYTSQMIRTLTYLGSHTAIPHIDGSWGDITKHRATIFRACGRLNVKNLHETEMIDYVVIKDIQCPICESFDVETGRYQLNVNDGYAEERNQEPGTRNLEEIDVKDAEQFKWVWKRYVFAGEDKPNIEHQSNFEEISRTFKEINPVIVPKLPHQTVTDRVISILSKGSWKAAEKIRDSLIVKTSTPPPPDKSAAGGGDV